MTFPITWYAIAALVAMNLFTGAMWRAETHKLELIELRSELAAQAAERVVAEQKQITEDTTNAWKAALDVTRDSWAKRLRVANVQPMPGISGPAGGIASLPTDSLALAAQCAETTEQLIALQSWVRKQHLVK
jgi:hypothetical protein